MIYFSKKNINGVSQVNFCFFFIFLKDCYVLGP